MLVLSYYLPAMLRLQNWELLFKLSRDGYSYHTFFDKLKSNDWTILLIKDTQGNRFGAFCTSQFEPERGFSGDCSSWVFSFYKGDNLNLWQATGQNDMY